MTNNAITQFQRLAQLSVAPNRRILGLMSGTSLDGLDIALCDIEGFGDNTRLSVKAFQTIAYPETVKQKIRNVFSKDTISLEYLTLLNSWLGSYHAELINHTLAGWGVSNQEVDLIASHGQTIYHCPKHQHAHMEFGNGTLQIGDADQIAVKTGIPTFSDFRQKHIAAGGEGAPLAVYGDYVLFKSKTSTRILLNLGGIANITLLPANGSLNSVLCSDIGPANTLVDAFMRHAFDLPYDDQGAVARRGTVNAQVLTALMRHPFIDKKLPKSTGPEVFNMAWFNQVLASEKGVRLKDEDIISTLTEFTACVVAKHISECAAAHENVEVFASGGGVANPYLCERIQVHLNKNIVWQTTDLLGINPDAKEAVLFAILANEAITSCNVSQPTTTNLTMGKLSLPF